MLNPNAIRWVRFSLFLIFGSGYLFSAMGISAPYLISALAIDDHHITIFWRNNDVTTTKFIILRKTSGAPFSFVDSVQHADATFGDSGGPRAETRRSGPVCPSRIKALRHSVLPIEPRSPGNVK